MESTLTQLPATKQFLFMKVGDHAGETFAQILTRKQREKDAAGMIFWGYGGAACHPLQQVQPFLKIAAQQGQVPYLLMHGVRSNSDQSTFPAKEFSRDGVNWEPIPKGISVTGSRYAIVLDELQPGDFMLDMRQYQVGIGPSRGKSAPEYLQGRTDKACLVKQEVERLGLPDPKEMKKIEFVAKIKEPYAVMLR